MQTTAEETDKHLVRLTVEVPPEEFQRDLDRAYRKVAGQVKIPGFRKGKVPKQIIDARIGREHVLEEFIKDSVPAYYVRALQEHDLAPIADPEIDLDRLEDGHPLRFTATVEVRPRLPDDTFTILLDPSKTNRDIGSWRRATKRSKPASMSATVAAISTPPKPVVWR